MKQTFWEFAADVASKLNNVNNMGGDRQAIENIEIIAKIHDGIVEGRSSFDAYDTARYILDHNRRLSRAAGFATI